MSDELFTVLKDRAMPQVGAKNQSGIWGSLEEERVDARHHDIVTSVHNEDRLLDFLELTISIGFWNHAQLATAAA